MNRQQTGVRARIGALAVLLTFGFVAVLARLFQIQVVSARDFAEMARREVLASALIERERGSILDRNGREMAVSLPVKSVYVDPALVRDADSLAERLGRALGLPSGPIAEKIRRNDGRRFVWIARKVDGDAARRVEAIGDPAVGFVGEYKRTYPFGTSTAHLLGFAGLDSIGLEGVELAYDDDLRGPPVEVEYVRDVAGNPVPRDGKVVHPHFEGHRVVLSIDLLVQSAAERALAEAVERYGASSGSVVAIDPRTGGVLAAAVWPPFDPNRFADAPAAARRNRAVTDLLEPGSVFKAYVAAALLEAGVVGPETVFHCPGEIEIEGFRIRCIDRHGRLTFREVVEKSCNVGMIEAARRLAPEALHATLEAFGFGRPTGIDIPGERSGLLRPVSQWSALSSSMLPIGQEVSATPLQLAAATAALATGRLVKPYVVAEVRDADGAVLKRRAPERGPRLVSAPTLERVRSILRGVVEAGTGGRAKPEGYAVAGKTGTAQIAGPGGYAEGKYNAVFAGWAPADDPVIAIAVVVREPDVSKGYYGGVVAAPVFREVAAAGLRALGRVPSADGPARGQARPEAAGPARGAAPAPGEVTPTAVRLPDLRGYTMREVHEALTAYPVRPRLLGSGVAVSQDPPPGADVRHGSTVTVRFGLPQAPPG